MSMTDEGYKYCQRGLGTQTTQKCTITSLIFTSITGQQVRIKHAYCNELIWWWVQQKAVWNVYWCMQITFLTHVWTVYIVHYVSQTYLCLPSSRITPPEVRISSGGTSDDITDHL